MQIMIKKKIIEIIHANKENKELVIKALRNFKDDKEIVSICFKYCP